MHAWIALTLAIVAEVIGTSCLKASHGFTKPWPSAVVIVGYGASFYFLARALETIPIGVGYAVWSGVGLVLISLAGWAFFEQSLDRAAVLGMGLILAGVAVLNLWSKTTPH